MKTLIKSKEKKILLYIQNNIRDVRLDRFMRLITMLGDAGIVWIVTAIGLISFENTRRVGIVGLAALITSVLINNVLLKNIIRRTRPCDEIEELIPLIRRPKDYSFPSGHTASSIAVAIIYFINLPLLAGIQSIVLALLIALSRLYIGVHYVTDVLGGACSGVIIGIVINRLMC